MRYTSVYVCTHLFPVFNPACIGMPAASLHVHVHLHFLPHPPHVLLLLVLHLLYLLLVSWLCWAVILGMPRLPVAVGGDSHGYSLVPSPESVGRLVVAAVALVRCCWCGGSGGAFLPDDAAAWLRPASYLALPILVVAHPAIRKNIAWSGVDQQPTGRPPAVPPCLPRACSNPVVTMVAAHLMP